MAIPAVWVVPALNIQHGHGCASYMGGTGPQNMIIIAMAVPAVCRCLSPQNTI